MRPYVFRMLVKIGGRRVVELELLADILDRGCKVCAKPLQLSNVTDETVSGLGSFLQSRLWGNKCLPPQHQTRRRFVACLCIRSCFCGLLVCTTIYLMIHYPRHSTCKNESNTCQCTDITLNIPTVCLASLKAREHEIGPAVENIANQSCDLEMALMSNTVA